MDVKENAKLTIIDVNIVNNFSVIHTVETCQTLAITCSEYISIRYYIDYATPPQPKFRVVVKVSIWSTRLVLTKHKFYNIFQN